MLNAGGLVGTFLCAVVLALGLTGCVASEEPPADDLPSAVQLPEEVEAEAERVELVAELDDRAYYRVTTGSGQVCAVIYGSRQSWVAGCGRGDVTVSGAGRTVAFSGDTAPDETGWTELGGGLWLRE